MPQYLRHHRLSVNSVEHFNQHRQFKTCKEIKLQIGSSGLKVNLLIITTYTNIMIGNVVFKTTVERDIET